MAIRTLVEDFRVPIGDEKSIEKIPSVIKYKDDSGRDEERARPEYYEELWGYYEVPLMRYKYGSPAETKATEFIVVEDFGCSPSGNWALGKLTGGNDIHVGFMINISDYFQTPHGCRSLGVRGLMSPYPENLTVKKTFNFDSSLYVLPGQLWEMPLRFRDISFDKDNPDKSLRAYIKYTLYDSVDAVIAGKLLGDGINVTPANIDWYKRRLAEEKTDTQITFDAQIGKGGRITIPEVARKKREIRDGDVCTVKMQVDKDDTEGEKGIWAQESEEDSIAMDIVMEKGDILDKWNFLFTDRATSIQEIDYKKLQNVAKTNRLKASGKKLDILKRVIEKMEVEWKRIKER